MPLQEYPFSKRYGWIQDKYGLSWQLILSDPEGEERPWERLSAVPAAEQCGWLKDKYGLSWQIASRQFGRLLGHPDRKRAVAALNATLKMKKIVIGDIEKAFEHG